MEVVHAFNFPTKEKSVFVAPQFITYILSVKYNQIIFMFKYFTSPEVLKNMFTFSLKSILDVKIIIILRKNKSI